MSSGPAIVPQGNDNSNSEETSVERIANGELEVNLENLGVTAEDLQALRRIEPHVAEASQRACQAAEEAGPSAPQMETRAKGKERQLTESKALEQYRQLKEEELCC